MLRLEVVREGKAPLRLRRTRRGFDIMHGGKAVAADVKLLSAGFHAPGQAFINLHDRCLFECAFCTLPASPGKGLPLRRWEELIKGALRSGKVDAVAVTSGVPVSASKTCRDIARLVRAIRRDFPNTPIGVEPYTVEAADLRLLKKAGAGELKLNIQCATGELTARICPGLDREGILRNLAEGVKIFGRGRVCSNLLIGLGETDAEALSAVEGLAAMGVAANLRPLRVNGLNSGPLTKSLGRMPTPPGPSRLLKLARAQKRIFLRHGLDPSGFRTMCHLCTACDVEPFRDV
jgi:biotin synthase-related radical SAM superfamily protein